MSPKTSSVTYTNPLIKALGEIRSATGTGKTPTGLPHTGPFNSAVNGYKTMVQGLNNEFAARKAAIHADRPGTVNLRIFDHGRIQHSVLDVPAHSKKEKTHATKVETKHAVKHETKHAVEHETKHAVKHETKHAVEHETKHAVKHETNSSLPLAQDHKETSAGTGLHSPAAGKTPEANPIFGMDPLAAIRGVGKLAVGKGLPVKAARSAGLLPPLLPPVKFPTLADEINKLNSAGDSYIGKFIPEVKTEVTRPKGDVGFKARLGSEFKVTRDSDDAKSTYTMRYDKYTLGMGLLNQGLPGASNTKMKAEAGLNFFDTIEMKFNSKADAIRASEIAEKMQTVDMWDDPLQGVGLSLPLRQPLALMGIDFGHPMANPLSPDGKPVDYVNDFALKNGTGVSKDDMAFMQKHITAIEDTPGVIGRLAGEMKTEAFDKLWLFDKVPQLKQIPMIGGMTAAFELGGEGNVQVKRRVEYPSTGADGKMQDGRVTFDLAGSVRSSLKSKVANKWAKNVEAGQKKPFLQQSNDNIQELTRDVVSASVSFKIPANMKFPPLSEGRPMPEIDAALSDKKDLALEKIQFKYVSETRDLTDLTLDRGFEGITTRSFTLKDPAKVGTAIKYLLDGDLQKAAEKTGTVLSTTEELVKQHNAYTQTTASFGLDKVFTVEGSLHHLKGVNDVVLKTVDTDDYGAIAKARSDAAEAARAAAAKAEAAAMASVPAPTVSKSEPKKQQPNTDPKNTNPDLERLNYAVVTVSQDDNLWDIATRLGVDPVATIKLNSAHLKNPSLIHPGDVIYLPGSNTEMP